MKQAFVMTTLFALTSIGCSMQTNQSVESNAWDQDAELAPAGVAMNGPVLQGVNLNGINFNGISLNGVNFNGISLNGAMLQGYATGQTVFLRGGELMAIVGQGTMVGGTDLEGTLLQGVFSDSSGIELRIDAVTPTNDAEIYEYTVSYRNGAIWENLCGYQNGLAIPALAVEGRWDESSGTPTGGDHLDDPNLFTFACTHATIAKCVTMGYAPWRSVSECSGNDCQNIPMRELHQACTRMLRADYCGDGTTHTVNGTTINLWDNLDIQTSDTALPVTWTDEAEWSPKGALCIQQVRWTGTAETYIDATCPKRWTSPDFDCFTTTSSFFTPNGYEMPLSERSLLRNQFTHDPY